MMRRFLLLVAAVVFLTTSLAVPASEPGRRSADGAWTTLAPEQLHALQRAGSTPRVRPDRFHAVAVEPDALAALLAQAPAEDLAATARPADAARIMLPTPDGEFAEFAVVDSPVFEEGLFETMAAMGFPQRTYRVWRVDNPAETGRIDFGGPAGFFAMIRGDEGSWYVDPFWMGDDRLHVSYWRRDFAPTDSHLEWRCHTEDDGVAWSPELIEAEGTTARGGSANLRTYRFACAATGEYTQFHGGTVSAGQAAVTTMTNRVNSVYEVDLGVRLILVANNTSVVYTNASSDPYTGTNVSTMLGQVRTDLNAKIGEANYDAGHVVSGTGSGGIAGAIGNICRNGTGSSGSPHKAQGATAWNSPVGDPFDIDYVAHELGHQFAGRHSFAYCGGGPGDSNSVAYEPGSGSTIMAYAGICGSGSNLQNNSDAMFHIMNILQIDSYVAGLGNCSTNTPTSNANQPTVVAGSAVSIPVGTPFELTPASFGDEDGDTLTFTWEQVDSDDTSPVTPANLPTSLVGPVYRSRLPSTSPTRAIPRIQEVRTGATPPFGERLSTVARSFTWRVTARDNNPGVGRIAWSQMIVTTVAGTPFAVTSPNGGESVGGLTTVTWQAGNTASAPINATAVDIYLSTDGGFTFPTLLAENVPNTGSAQITIPGPVTTTARLKIKGRGNIFYDISNNNFSIISSQPLFAMSGEATPQDTTGNGNSNGYVDPGESDIRIPVSIVNSGGAAATNVAATLSSLTGTATVTTAGPATYGNLAPGASAAGSSAFAISVDPSHPCGAPINLRVSVTSDTASNTFDFSLETGRVEPGEVIFADGFESGNLSAWSLAQGNWASRTNAQSNATPRTGSRLGSFEPSAATTTTARLVTPDLANPTEMTFWHTYRMEDWTTPGEAYDGLFLEVSTNGGATFTQIPAARIIVGTPYTHAQIADSGCTSGSTVGTPLWSGGAIGPMQQVTVDLSPWSAQTIRVAFRYNEDCGFVETGQGWYLDDVTVSGPSSVICDEPTGGGNVPPTATIIVPDSNQTVAFSTTEFAFGGSAEDTDGTVSTVWWRNNGTGWTAASGTTTWSFTVTGLSVDDNLVEVRAEDNEGAFSEIVARTITRQPNALPTIEVITPDGDRTVSWQTTTFPFGGSASDSDGTVAAIEWNRNGTGWTAASGTTTWEFTAIGLEVGANVIEVRALDNLGAPGTPVTRTITRTALPAGADIMSYLLGYTSDPAGLDVDGDGVVTVADLVFVVNNP